MVLWLSEWSWQFLWLSCWNSRVVRLNGWSWEFLWPLHWNYRVVWALDEVEGLLNCPSHSPLRELAPWLILERSIHKKLTSDQAKYSLLPYRSHASTPPLCQQPKLLIAYRRHYQLRVAPLTSCQTSPIPSRYVRPWNVDMSWAPQF